MDQDTHDTTDTDDDQQSRPGTAEDATRHLPTTRRTFLGSIAAASALSGGGAAAAATGGGGGAIAQEAASAHGYGVGGYGEGPYGGGSDPGDDPPPLPGQDNPPQDLNGDGLYRDVNGDDQFTIADVQVFFIHRDSDVVQDNAECFNFDETDPPAVSIGDVQALFLDFTNGVDGINADRIRNDSLGNLGDPDSAADIDVRSLFGGE